MSWMEERENRRFSLKIQEGENHLKIKSTSGDQLKQGSNDHSCSSTVQKSIKPRENEEGIQKKTYVEALGKDQDHRMKLTFIPPDVIEGKSVVKYHSIDVLPGVNRWSSAAYGFVMGINPNFGAIENYAKKNWSKFGFAKCFRVAAGLFLFQFEEDEGRDAMLASGPWIFAQYPMVLQTWNPDLKMERRGVEKIPVWIRIPFLSLQFWTEEMLSKIGSYIGNPIFADKATSTIERIAYARLYVEIEASQELVHVVPLVNEKGEEFLQSIEYEWMPFKCSHCVVFGHDVKHCKHGGQLDKRVVPEKIEKVWKPKIVEEADTGRSETDKRIETHIEEGR